MAARTVLVTGAAGFVGSHALEALARRDGVRPIAACRDRRRLPPGYAGEVREGDLRDPAYLANLFDGVDALVQAASWTSVWGRSRQSASLFRDMATAVNAAAVAAGVSRIVNISTTAAASPDTSSDARGAGIPRPYWPHLGNVIALEDQLRDLSARVSVVNLRLGFFAGRRHGLGFLPILVPRLRTHLVPWVDGGRTHLPIIGDRDIGQACALAATAPGMAGFESFNVAGPEIPTVRQVIDFLHAEWNLPRPHFSVPFPVAFAFAGLMELIDPLVPWEPLVTRSIVHMMEEPSIDNAEATRRLGYRPEMPWREAIRAQMAEMGGRAARAVPMAKPLPT